MTVETQTFIALRDLVGLRLECRNCNKKTSVPIPSDSKLLSYPHGFTCPHCQHPWFEGPNDKRLEVITVFLDRFERLHSLKLPFDLQLEISSIGAGNK